jgi:hypothetical protein
VPLLSDADAVMVMVADVLNVDPLVGDVMATVGGAFAGTLPATQTALAIASSTAIPNFTNVDIAVPWTDGIVIGCCNKGSSRYGTPTRKNTGGEAFPSKL